jgi:uncharacterized protein
MKTNFRISLMAIPLLAGLALSAAFAGPNQAAPSKDTTFASVKVAPRIGIRAYPFSLKNVRLLDGPFKQAMDRDLKYMLSLDPDRLLHSFRQTAGLPTSAKPYGGWEDPEGRAPSGELRGHTIGHYLSACAFMSAATGDAKIKANADTVVAELAKCQAALGTSGYLSAYPEEFFDRVFSVRRVWAPFYTLHKILAGLVDMYDVTGNAQALEVAEKIAHWVKSRTDQSTDRHMEIVLNHTEQGGMNEVLANLYSLTGNPEYLATARRFDEKHYTEPLAAHRDELKGEHVNSFIPNVIGAAREYELTGDPVLYDIATFFWNQVTGARCYVTGGTSNDENWRADPYVISTELGRDAHESCCTYNMLKLTRHLFSWEPKAAYADYYERALLNGILSTQDPETAMMMYYVPMMPGLYRTFMSPENSFWCCTGTGMENHGKYGDSIYFHDADGVYVNLFIASELKWPEKGFGLRQETKFPEEGKTTLVVTAAGTGATALRIRIPGWVEKGGYVKINGRKHDAFAEPSSYLVLKRAWSKGDRIEVVLPMALRLERTPDNTNVAAILYGPVVLAGKLGGEGLVKDKVFGSYGPTGDPVAVPKLAAGNADPGAWIQPVAGTPLTFRTNGVGKPADVTLVPFYKLFGERYTIYWEFEPASK